jgi:hypothetical protein
MLFLCAATILAITPSAHAQGSGCGAHIQQSPNKLIYPKIARNAHIAGTVVLLIAFDHDGIVKNERVVAGPEALRQAALDYAKSLHAEPSEGSRECPFTVRYQISNCDETQPLGGDSATVCSEIIVDTVVSEHSAKRNHRFLNF